ncbi:Wdr19, partial [Symbiodinium sp. KB8]
PVNEDKCLDEAVDVVGRSRNEQLVNSLIDHLTGDADGVPKDPQYIFKLYMALDNFEQAAKAAIVIADNQRIAGNYRVAHGVLFEMHRELMGEKSGSSANDVRVPSALVGSLELLHSYVLARRLVKSGDHEGAARLLLRCVDDLSRFAFNATAVLTMTVVECHRAGLKRSATEFARVLMDDEHREKIDGKLRRNIEALVRRPGKTEKDQETSPCPVCSFALGAWESECPSCKTHLPRCVVTGRHMVLDDWSSCPRCNWPALFSHLGRMVEENPSCPMCEQTVALGTPQLTKDPAAELQKWVSQTARKPSPGKEEEDEKDGAERAAAASAAAAAPARGGATMAALGALGLS